MKKKYKYNGQIIYSTIAGVDYCFENGSEYSLPSDDSYVIILVASGSLVETKEEKETTLKKS